MTQSYPNPAQKMGEALPPSLDAELVFQIKNDIIYVFYSIFVLTSPSGTGAYSSGPNNHVVPNKHVGWTVSCRLMSMWS